MRFIQPIFLTITGIVVFIGGFIYDGIFAGIPYQDPTPEMLTSWNYHSAIAGKIVGTGLLLFMFGFVWGIFRKVGENNQLRSFRLRTFILFGRRD